MFSIWMPFAEHTLQDLLDSPLFAPTVSPTFHGTSDHPEVFITVVRSLACQMVSAVTYLHDPAQSIAHRDIKPGNFLLTASGCIKLVDFGTSYEFNAESREQDMWPESPGKLYAAVATG
jgi:serine/threonine protein kinase